MMRIIRRESNLVQMRSTKKEARDVDSRLYCNYLRLNQESLGIDPGHGGKRETSEKELRLPAEDSIVLVVG